MHRQAFMDAAGTSSVPGEAMRGRAQATVRAAGELNLKRLRFRIKSILLSPSGTPPCLLSRPAAAVLRVHSSWPGELRAKLPCAVLQGGAEHTTTAQVESNFRRVDGQPTRSHRSGQHSRQRWPAGPSSKSKNSPQQRSKRGGVRGRGCWATALITRRSAWCAGERGNTLVSVQAREATEVAHWHPCSQALRMQPPRPQPQWPYCRPADARRRPPHFFGERRCPVRWPQASSPARAGHIVMCQHLFTQA